jgi:uncharacterized protein YcbK (DUF882 family)
MDKKLTPNLKVSDMVINSGSSSYGRISRGFVGALEDYIQLLKDNNMTPIITSAYRTWYHNCELISQGAVNNSNHIDGIAADVKVGDENVSVALGIAKEMFWGVGKYSNRVHVDFGEARTW